MQTPIIRQNANSQIRQNATFPVQVASIADPDTEQAVIAAKRFFGSVWFVEALLKTCPSDQLFLGSKSRTSGLQTYFSE